MYQIIIYWEIVQAKWFENRALALNSDIESHCRAYMGSNRITKSDKKLNSRLDTVGFDVREMEEKNRE